MQAAQRGLADIFANVAGGSFLNNFCKNWVILGAYSSEISKFIDRYARGRKNSIIYTPKPGLQVYNQGDSLVLPLIANLGPSPAKSLRTGLKYMCEW